MNQNEQLILWAGVAVVVAIAVIGLIVSKIQQKKDEKLKAYVLETSERYRDILKLNEEFFKIRHHEERWISLCAVWSRCRGWSETSC